MTYMQALLGFAVLAGAMAMVPGLDMVMTMNEAIHYGRRNGIMAGFGIQCGVLVWAVAASLGLAALISAFPLAYDIIRVIGGMYLFYLAWSMSGMSDWAKRKLGIATKQTEMQPREAADDSTASTESVARSMIAPTSKPSLFSSWWRGFLTDFFNPKIGVFYIAVIPQFLVSGVGNLQMGLSLGLIHAIEGGGFLPSWPVRPPPSPPNSPVHAAKASFPSLPVASWPCLEAQPSSTWCEATPPDGRSRPRP